MPESTEQQPANNKPKQSAYLVCEGALCKCDAGAAPVKLKVDSHKKAYINNNKLLATVKDVKFELPTAPFVTCKNIPSQNKTCQPQFEKWTKPYKDIEVEGNQVITDKSELKCIAYGGTITIEMHGQQQEVNETQANNVDRNIATQVNPLADFVPLNIDTAKTVRVNSISGELVDDPKYKSVTGQQIAVVKSEKKDDHVDIYVRPGQEVEFKTVHKGEASLVSWKLTSAKGPMHFLQHGPIYKTSFPEVGKYTIEGYGTGGDNNLDVDTKIVDGTVKGTKEIKKRGDDKECMLDILVQDNKLTGIRHLPSENIIAGKVGDKTGVHVRIGVPVTFEPVYLMPPIQKEIDHLILVIKDASGNEVQRTKGTSNIIFAAQNSSAMYSAEAYFDNSDAKPFIYLFKTAANSVSVIAASGMKYEGDKIRTGTTLTFTVSKFKFENDDVQEELVHAELANIKWYESSNEPVAIGTTSYSKVYSREGKFVVTCAVLEKSAGWFNTKKNEADDWNFTVTRNYPTAIEQKSEGKVKVGKKVIFELKSIFDVTYEDERTIHWQLTGPENRTLEKSHYFILTPNQNGVYKLTVSMNGKSIDKTFECITCEIVNGWWTDSDGNILTGDDDEPSNTIGSAGWKQQVVATFQHVGLNGEEVTLEVFDKDVNGTTSVYTKDFKVPDAKNAVTCSFQLDDVVKNKIKENSLSSSGLLYFTVKSKNGLKLIYSGLALPKNENYLEVNDTVRVRAYFADNNDTKRYSTAALYTPVYLQVKTKNLIDEELEFEIWSSKSSSKPLTSRYAFQVDKYGMASIKLNMKAFESELPTAKDSTTAYFKIYIKKTGHQPFTGENKPKLTVYKTLATSPASIGTTKAFVVVDVSEGEKNNVKQIVFPLLVKPENDKENKWGTNYYWADKQCTNQTTYYAWRSNKTRRHAGRDLYTNPFTSVVAVCDGEVLEIKIFYAETFQVTIKHETNDGRKFIIRYGELDPNSITVKEKDFITQGQYLGKTGKLKGIVVIPDFEIYMLHFEYYTGSLGLDINNPLSDNSKPFQRRIDLSDPLVILNEGYKNSFEQSENKSDRTFVTSLSTSEKCRKFIKDYEDLKLKAYNDSENYCSIGYGYLIAHDKCENITLPNEFKNSITVEKANELFNLKLNKFENLIQKEITSKLHQYEYDALVSLIYNMGSFKKCPILKSKINSGDYKGAANEFLDITNGGTPGLVARRKAENKMFLNNIYDSTH